MVYFFKSIATVILASLLISGCYWTPGSYSDKYKVKKTYREKSPQEPSSSPKASS